MGSAVKRYVSANKNELADWLVELEEMYQCLVLSPEAVSADALGDVWDFVMKVHEVTQEVRVLLLSEE